MPDGGHPSGYLASSWGIFFGVIFGNFTNTLMGIFANIFTDF
jgi:hypothetical protein